VVLRSEQVTVAAYLGRFQKPSAFMPLIAITPPRDDLP